jgi:hypothetical protein
MQYHAETARLKTHVTGCGTRTAHCCRPDTFFTRNNAVDTNSTACMQCLWLDLKTPIAQHFQPLSDTP